jgi:thiamine biosynthesis lipoprotein
VSAKSQHSFACFGGTVSVHVLGVDSAKVESDADRARADLLDAHDRLTRFSPDSELSRLNRDPREEVPASPLLRRLAVAVAMAGRYSDGLVDATLLDQLERAGYRESLAPGGREPPPRFAVQPRPSLPARPHPDARWRSIRVDENAGTVVRPPGVRIDSGGLAKGLLADLVGESLSSHLAYAVDCCGDVRVGGRARRERRVLVDDPSGGSPIHEFRLAAGAVATSGIGRRSWAGDGGEAAHHLLDPSTGRPAFTGLIQVTALAPTALLAEVFAKSALLSGPGAAGRWLPHGGVVVGEDGGVDILTGPRSLMIARVA